MRSDTDIPEPLLIGLGFLAGLVCLALAVWRLLGRTEAARGWALAGRHGERQTLIFLPSSAYLWLSMAIIATKPENQQGTSFFDLVLVGGVLIGGPLTMISYWMPIPVPRFVRRLLPAWVERYRAEQRAFEQQLANPPRSHPGPGTMEE